MTTTPALDDITHLDFDEALPCETPFHEDHRPTADWVITVTCCIGRNYVICNDCLETLVRAGCIDCAICDARYHDYRDVITQIRSLHA